MRWSNYSKLKTASKISFAKVDEVKDSDGNVTSEAYVNLVQKRFDANTGEALDDSVREMSLSELENEKARYDKDVAEAQSESDELAKMITDFKAL
tara:strand:- start:1198 stop:1482 length:285 start_codon:yes stop_codon:yes gene_type:complete